MASTFGNGTPYDARCRQDRRQLSLKCATFPPPSFARLRKAARGWLKAVELTGLRTQRRPEILRVGRPTFGTRVLIASIRALNGC
jgi:hypothetical protein